MSAAISTDVSVEHRSTYRSTHRPMLDQHPSTDMSVAMSTDISVEHRSICRPTYRPICRSRCRPTYRSRGSQTTHDPSVRVLKTSGIGSISEHLKQPTKFRRQAKVWKGLTFQQDKSERQTTYLFYIQYQNPTNFCFSCIKSTVTEKSIAKKRQLF